MSTLNQKKADRFIRIGFVIILLLGLFLRGYQYFMNRPLWHDEAALSLNFIYHGYAGLMDPLTHWQAAPILFLYSVETCTKLFGFNEMILRLTPFIISVFTLPVFYYLCLELLKNRTAALIAFLLFSVNISFVYYASEVKPYVIDACMFIVIPWIVITSNAFVSKYRTVLLTITSCIAVLMTNTAAVILLSVGLYLIIQWFSGRSESGKRRIKIPAKDIWFIGIVAVVFLANYFRFIHSHPYAEGMKNEWAWAFWPVNPLSDEFNTFIGYRIWDTFYFLIHYSADYYFGYVFLAFFIIGIISVVVKKEKTIFLFVVLPIIVQIVLSMLKVYPFYARFVLNILPAALILFTIGLYRAAAFIAAKTHYALGAVLVVVCLLFTTEDSIEKFPKWELDIKPCLKYIHDNYPDMPVLLTTPSTMYQFYHKTGYVANGNFENIRWDLTPESYFEQEPVKSKHSNYIVLHSNRGGDNFEPILEELYKRGLVENAFSNNNFQVTEVKPVAE